MTERISFNTGYESKLPLGSDLKIFKGMVERGREKNEGSYVSYFLQLYSHIPLAVVKFLKLNSKLGEFEQEVLRLPDPIQRIQILNKIYLACRGIDDAIDGDTPISLTPEDLIKYAHIAELHFTNEDWDSTFVPDKYFSEALRLCKKINIYIRNEVLQVIGSMKFDAQRRSKFLETGEIDFIHEKDLKDHYYQLDIEGTVGVMLTLVDEENSKENRDLIQPLGEVMRIYYDIQDLGKEIRQGLVNIPSEDIDRFNIDKDQLVGWARSNKSLQHAPAEVLSWAKSQMNLAEYLFKKFQTNIRNASFKPLTLLFFEKQYVKHYEKFKTENTFLLIQ